MFRQHNIHTKGFTLVELLVVITIIGVLATMIIANFSTVRSRARDAKRKSDLQAIKTALRIYYNDYQRYPAASSGTIAGCGANGTTSCPWGSAFATTGATGQQYMKQIPLDPLNNTTTGYVYTYAQTSGGDGFTISARLENASDTDSAKSQQRCGVSVVALGYAICED